MPLSLEVCRDRVHQAAVALAVGCHVVGAARSATVVPAAQVTRWTATYADEWFPSSSATCPLLADGFDRLETQLAEYVRAIPLEDGGASGADVQRCRDWLVAHAAASDAVPAEHSPTAAAVEFVALKQRLGHLRFQALLRGSAARLAAAADHSRLQVQFNPIHVWSSMQRPTSHDACGGAPHDEPATVLFCAVDADTRTVVLPPDVADWLRTLARSGPQKLRAALARIPAANSAEAFGLLRRLADLGVIAVG